jgi:hypothetical protein
MHSRNGLSPNVSVNVLQAEGNLLYEYKISRSDIITRISIFCGHVDVTEKTDNYNKGETSGGKINENPSTDSKND